jgi:6-pyruvoyl-tetrahydropterin synthase
LDHRCLFKDESRFVTEASTLERITLWIAQELQRPVTITEADRLRCRAEPSSSHVEISIQCRNLWLGFLSPVDSESGLALCRRDVRETVDQVFKEFSSLGSQDEHAWGDRLWQALSTRLKNLKWVTVDLGGQKTVRLAESPLRNR